MRVLAATNLDLEASVANGSFREDLYYRLKVLPLRVPSLAERAEDIADLARAFCRRAAERHGLPRVELSSAALRALEATEWPGNIRELDNVIEAGCIRAAGRGEQSVERRHLFPDAATGDSDASAENAATFQEATRAFQRELLASVLEETGWNISAAARRLDLTRSHIYNLIKAFEIQR